VGVDYLKLGQPSPTLSGGEAQRIKLARELSRKATGRTLYILDEPTTGLHFDDVRKLVGVLARLTEAGNSVIVIEHNLDVIKVADYVVDLGPEGGPKGGELIGVGTPEALAENTESFTGQYLAALVSSARGAHSVAKATPAHASGRDSERAASRTRDAKAKPARTKAADRKRTQPALRP
jgi:excinuclease ABC subunit A